MKVVIAGNYGEFMDWYWSSGLDREECYYLATYKVLDPNDKYPIPMIDCKEDLLYIGSYKDNLNWHHFHKTVLVPQVKIWKKYWESIPSQKKQSDTLNL